MPSLLPMVNRKAAAEIAAKHLTELIPIEGTPVLEEHFFSDDIWQITLSYKPALPLHAVNGNAYRREFKSFAIDGRSGEVLSMKIRVMKD